ncbi:uncharacterized protein HaLaN_23433 [Haematococcus lacustris]|uniref:Uncharacterized protein n=1 Tax=Haematococcus lacustris TaxID=44745 RepID=A0A699ZU40_HAELA|nr:uncharacterized protein HaLaN_23433 [Haematococcus lacustris]
MAPVSDDAIGWDANLGAVSASAPKDEAARRRALAMSRLLVENVAMAATALNQPPRKHTPRKGRWDEIKLWQLGYKQELHRSLSWVANAACAYNIMGFWAVMGMYARIGMANGGPVVVIWGWVLVSCFSMAIALCMAELVSAFPTSGGLYYWSYMLAPVSGWKKMVDSTHHTSVRAAFAMKCQITELALRYEMVAL